MKPVGNRYFMKTMSVQILMTLGFGTAKNFNL